MGWFKRCEKAPVVAPQPVASVNDFMALITALTNSSVARHQATMEHDAKVEEISLKKRELELTHAEQIAQAAAIDRESRSKLRESKKLWAREHADQIRPKGKAPSCKVCTNPSDPSLSDTDIKNHYAHMS